MKIEVGKWYKCRNGYKAYVEYISDPPDEINPKANNFPLRGYIKTRNERWTTTSWTLLGKNLTNMESEWDLVEPWIEDDKVFKLEVSWYESQTETSDYSAITKLSKRSSTFYGSSREQCQEIVDKTFKGMAGVTYRIREFLEVKHDN